MNLLAASNSASYPRVAVIIVTWNKRDHVLALLKSLRAIGYPGWQILIVDNCSSDGTIEAIQSRYPEVHCLLSPANLGGCGGFNAGMCAVLEQGTFDYVWLLDNDVEVEPGALECLLDALETHPDAGLAGSHMLQLDFPGITNEIGAKVDLVRGQLRLHHHESPSCLHGGDIYDVDYVAAASMLVRFSALQEIGIWDDLFIHYDDVDFCLRMKTAGWRVLACSGSRIYHVSAKSKRVTWVHYYDLRNVLYLQHKYGHYGAWHFIKFTILYAWFNVRDEWSGKTYYGRLAYRALLDFYRGNMGKALDLPSFNTVAAKPVLERIAKEPARRIYLKIPSSRIFFTEDQQCTMQSYRSTVSVICHEHDTVRQGAPPGCRAITLPSHRLAMSLQILRLLLFRPRADYLIADIDSALGPLGLCAKRIVLMVDDQCLEIPGAGQALWRSVKACSRWLGIISPAILFFARRHPGQAFAAQSPESFRKKLALSGGIVHIPAKASKP